MKRVMLVVAYDGTNYNGWQIQPNKRTIEGEINESLSNLLKEEIKISGASRTDTGVHALCNLAVFDTKTKIPAEKISFALNQSLSEDIRVRKSIEVPLDFHPRYEETIKTYEYRILNDKMPVPTKRLYSHFCYYNLDVEKMKKAGEMIVGEHDFAGFCSAGTQVLSTVRDVTAFSIQQVRDDSLANEIVIRVSGKGFLYNMVRIIAGTLIEVGRGAMPLDDVRRALDEADRSLSGPTAPACGLTLVNYEFLNPKLTSIL